MKRTLRGALKLLVAAPLVLAAFAANAEYPDRPVRIVIPYPPGGISDKLLRPIAQKMGEDLKVPFVIDNKPGANGLIGTEQVAKSAPDGYTLVMGSTSTLPMNAALNPKMPFDPIKDLAPVTSFAIAPQVLTVNPNVPAKTVQELIALAKSRPGEITYATPGIGSSPHFAGEMFSTMTGVKMLHVPYKGGAPASMDLIAGQVMVGFDSIGSAAPYIRANKLRALGLAAPKRSPAMPDLPTISEAGVPGFEVGTLFALFAPANTPRDVINKLYNEMVRVLASPEIRDSMVSVGTEPIAMTPEQLGDNIKSDMVKWAKVAREANIHAE